MAAASANLLLIEQRFGRLEIKFAGAIAELRVIRHFGGALRRGLRGLKRLMGFRIVNRQALEYRGVLGSQGRCFAGRVFGGGILVQTPICLRERHPDAAIARRQFARRLQIGSRRSQFAPLKGGQTRSKRNVERGGGREQQ